MIVIRAVIRSSNDSFGQNYSKLGSFLMTEDELKRMPRDTSIVQITSLRPFKDKKYPLGKYPLYKYHSQGDNY